MDLKLNTAQMNAPHSINELFVIIINQIEIATDFANSIKVPYIPEQVVTTSYGLIFVVGYLANAYC